MKKKDENRKSAAEAAQQAAEEARQATQQAFDELSDFEELHKATIDRYQELEEKYSQLLRESTRKSLKAVKMMKKAMM